MNIPSARRSRWWPTPRTTTSAERSRKSVVKRGSVDPAREQLALVAHVLDRVVGEALERLADLVSPRLGFAAHALSVEHLAAPDRLAAAEHLRGHGRSARPADPDHHRVAVGDRVEQGVIRQVHQQDPGLDEQLRPEVRVGAARGASGVEDRTHFRRDQLLRRDAVQVDVVDQGDVAAHEMPDQQLRAPARAHRTADAERQARRRRRARPAVGRREACRARSRCGHRSESNARGRRACRLTRLRRRAGALAHGGARCCRRCRRRASEPAPPRPRARRARRRSCGLARRTCP